MRRGIVVIVTCIAAAGIGNSPAAETGVENRFARSARSIACWIAESAPVRIGVLPRCDLVERATGLRVGVVDRGARRDLRVPNPRFVGHPDREARGPTDRDDRGAWRRDLHH